MDSSNTVHCLYCENPRPNITSSRHGGVSGGSGSLIPPNINFQSNSDTTITPIIDCRFCKRRYYLYATAADREFLRSIIMRLHYNELSVDSMKNYGLDIDDITRGFLGITGPKRIYDKIYNSGDFHILFRKDQKTYSLICVRNDLNRMAINLEELSV